jgi:hypothetical protein
MALGTDPARQLYIYSSLLWKQGCLGTTPGQVLDYARDVGGCRPAERVGSWYVRLHIHIQHSRSHIVVGRSEAPTPELGGVLMRATGAKRMCGVTRDELPNSSRRVQANRLTTFTSYNGSLPHVHASDAILVIMILSSNRLNGSFLSVISGLGALT